MVTGCHRMSHLAPLRKLCNMIFRPCVLCLWTFFLMLGTGSHNVFGQLPKGPGCLRLSHLCQNNVAMFNLRSLLQNGLENILQSSYLLLKINSSVQVVIPILKGGAQCWNEARTYFRRFKPSHQFGCAAILFPNYVLYSGSAQTPFPPEKMDVHRMNSVPVIDSQTRVSSGSPNSFYINK